MENKSQLSTRWLFFYTYILLPFNIFFSFGLPLAEQEKFLEQGIRTQINPMVFVPIIIVSMFISFVIYGLHKRRLWGWTCNWGFLVGTTLMGPMNTAPDIGTYIVAIILMSVMFLLPNYIYFKKRRYLFDPLAAQGSLTNDSLNPANAEQHIVIQQHIPKATQVLSHSREASTTSVSGQLEVAVEEDRIYASIARELETGAEHKGLWTRLFAECGGDEKQTKVLYIKQRAERLISEERSRLEQAARVHAHEASRIEQVRLNKELADKIQALSASHTAVMMFTNVAQNNLQEVRRLLSEEPLLIAVKNRDRETPLHIAVREKNPAMARLLLEKGAITDENNCYWVTPLEYAKNSKQVEMVKLLTAQVGEFTS